MFRNRCWMFKLAVHHKTDTQDCVRSDFSVGWLTMPSTISQSIAAEIFTQFTEYAERLLTTSTAPAPIAFERMCCFAAFAAASHLQNVRIAAHPNFMLVIYADEHDSEETTQERVISPENEMRNSNQRSLTRMLFICINVLLKIWMRCYSYNLWVAGSRPKFLKIRIDIFFRMDMSIAVLFHICISRNDRKNSMTAT